MFFSPSRVASRHQERQAGIFEAPPLVLKAVESWCLEKYASNVLAKILPYLERKPDKSQERIRQMEKLLESGALMRLISKLKPEQSVRIPIGFRRDMGLKLVDPDETYDTHLWLEEVGAGQRFKFPRRPRTDRWGEFVDPNAYYEDFLGSSVEVADVIRRVTDKLERGLREARPQPPGNPRLQLDDNTLVELSLIRKECLKYTSKAKAYKTKAVTKIPVDLKGWKYLQGIPMSQVEVALKEARLTEFTLVLFFQAHKRRSGLWDIYRKEMSVDIQFGSLVDDLEHFRTVVSDIRETCRHEVQHLGQDALRIVKGLREDAGLPSRHLREDGKLPSGVSELGVSNRRIDHAQRDVEFYTRLADEVHQFVDAYKRVPLPNRRRFLKNWVKTHDFFAKIKKNKPKWEKAVSEFYAALGKEGIYFPRAAKSYKVDKSKIPSRNPKAEKEMAEEYGFYEYVEFDLVPLSDIEAGKAFNEGRLRNIRDALHENKALPPIKVREKGGKLYVQDGNHRYHASVEAGFPYIPVLREITVEDPKRYVPPEPEKPQLKPGAWVRLKKPPSYLSSPWAQVEERLGPRWEINQITDERIDRHVYSLVGMKHGEGRFIGDWSDGEFEAGGRPPRRDAEKIQEAFEQRGGL